MQKAPKNVDALERNSREVSWKANRAWIEKQRANFQPKGVKRVPKWDMFEVLLQAFLLLLRLFRLDNWGYRNACRPKLTNVIHKFSDLPSAFDGYRILHITDPHFDLLPAIGERVTQLIGPETFDLCVFTGDYLGGMEGDFHIALDLMEQVASKVKAKDGMYATLGNHDSIKMVDRLTQMGFHVLGNETIEIKRDVQSIYLTGIDDVHKFYSVLASRALQTSPKSEGAFKMAAVHSAEIYDEAEENGYQFYFCGHTHGGQICLPFGRPLVTHLSQGRRFARGRWRYGKMQGYTSRGTGISGIPIRFNCPGEVAVYILETKPKKTVT